MKKPPAPKTLKVYMVRDMATGLFDTGKTHPSWSRAGKRWKSLGYVRGHFTSMRVPVKSTWEIVEYELVETGRFSAASIVSDDRIVGL